MTFQSGLRTQKKDGWRNRLPILQWGRQYNRGQLSADLIAAVIVTIMLIPQSLAYALLAGLPPEAGLYASIAPLILYAFFGTSNTLAVGPVAVLSLMTASAIAALPLTAADQKLMAALALALLSGAILLAMGFLRLGFIANFLSHPVISGFITATGILIALGQLKYLLGIDSGGHSLPDLVTGVWSHLEQVNLPTMTLGLTVLAFLIWLRWGFKPLSQRIGIPIPLAEFMMRAGPIFVVILSILITWKFNLTDVGIAIVGDIPTGLPPVVLPDLGGHIWLELMAPAGLIALIGFVESVSVAQTLAAKRRQRIDPNQELIGLGSANLAAGVTGGYPVTGGFARSVVNFDAGAKTPAAGAFTAIAILAAALFLTPLLYFLPKATLAATIIVAVLSLVKIEPLRECWHYSRADFAAVSATILLTLGLGVEMGISGGVLLSIALYLYRTSRPHIAEIGLVPGTEHFRNIRRHDVTTNPTVLCLRVDESLYFANARFLEDVIYDRVVGDRQIHDLILQCTAINEIDTSALESLEAINHRLGELDIRLHLSEVKGPVMDRLKRSDFLDQLSGNIYLSQYEALSSMNGIRD